jgi:hypothetical protein
MMEIAVPKSVAQTVQTPDGYKIITLGTKWIIFGVGVCFLLPFLTAIVGQSLAAAVPQPQPPISTQDMAFMPGAIMIVVGLHRWLIGGILYAREVWKLE